MGRSIASGGGAGASGKPPCFSAGIFIPCWFFRRLRPEGNAGKQQAERTAVRAAPIVCPEESHPACMKRGNSAVSNSLWWGLTRRLRRGLGLAVPWGAHTFLSVAKEKCAKESQRHGDSGKKPFMPIFERGSSQCRAQHSWIANIYVRARSCSLFSSFKKGKAFSLRCLSPLCSGAVGGGQAYPLRVKIVLTAWRF